MKTQKSQQFAFIAAIEEIEYNIKLGPINSSIYSPWLNKWKNLFQTFDLPALFGDEKKFYNYYYYFNQLNEFLLLENAAKEAVDKFLHLNTLNEEQLLGWLVCYETLGSDLSLFVYDVMHEGLDESKEEVAWRFCKIDIKEFKMIIQFCIKFHEHYYLALKKWDTFSEEEKEKHGNEEYFSDKMLSLTFHLKMRGNVNF